MPRRSNLIDIDFDITHLYLNMFRQSLTLIKICFIPLNPVIFQNKFWIEFYGELDIYDHVLTNMK